MSRSVGVASGHFEFIGCVLTNLIDKSLRAAQGSFFLISFAVNLALSREYNLTGFREGNAKTAIWRFDMKTTFARTCALALISSLTVSAAIAAPVGAVISACDRMHGAGQTCNYGIKGNSLVGCTNDVVFECPADGSRQCTGSKNTSGKCNEDGTAARVSTLKGNELLDSLHAKDLHQAK
ncbi:MAG: hypothetical protein FD172_3933 [Methylocystaceae bacterium]|nr:MAG: hypothetical protein FD172_3933 [Methylocystaceae bacterium]